MPFADIIIGGLLPLLLCAVVVSAGRLGKMRGNHHEPFLWERSDNSQEAAEKQKAKERADLRHQCMVGFLEEAFKRENDPLYELKQLEENLESAEMLHRSYLRYAVHGENGLYSQSDRERIEDAERQIKAAEAALAEYHRTHAQKPELSKHVPELDFDDRRCKKLYAMYHKKLVQLNETSSDLTHKAQAFISPMFVTMRSFPELKRSLFKSIHHDNGDPVFTRDERALLMQEIKPLIDEMKFQPA